MSECVIHMVILIIAAFYINKFIRIFPFVGKNLSSKYIPSKHKESTIGIGIGLSYIYSKSQPILSDKISFLVQSFSHKLII